MFRYFAILVGLMVLAPNTSANLGISTGDTFDYTLLQSQNNSVEGVATFIGELGELKIPVGGVFTITLSSTEKAFNLLWGTYVNITMSYNGQKINSTTGTDESDGFFIDMDFETYRTQRANDINSFGGGDQAEIIKVTLIETNSEIGVQREDDINYKNTDGSGGYTLHIKNIYRYSKVDGVLNYLFGEFHWTNWEGGSNAVNTVTQTQTSLIEYSRVGYELQNSKLHFTIPWGTSWLVGLIMFSLVRKKH